MSKERPYEIVKVQVPLLKNEKGPAQFLIYSEGHKHIRQQTLPPAMASFLKGEKKMFFWATLSEKTNTWQLIKPAPFLEW